MISDFVFEDIPRWLCFVFVVKRTLYEQIFEQYVPHYSFVKALQSCACWLIQANRLKHKAVSYWLLTLIFAYWYTWILHNMCQITHWATLLHKVIFTPGQIELDLAQSYLQLLSAATLWRLSCYLKHYVLVHLCIDIIYIYIEPT